MYRLNEASPALLSSVVACRTSRGAAGRRLLLFLKFTEMLGSDCWQLGSAGMPYFYLDGEMPAATWVGPCNRFNDGEENLYDKINAFIIIKKLI